MTNDAHDPPANGGSRDGRREFRTSWRSMLRTSRAAAGVLAFGLLGVTVPPQTQDLMETLHRQGAAVGFHIALLVLGFSAWFWSRAALAARFGIRDSPDAARRQQLSDENPNVDIAAFIWLPRLLFTFSAIIGLLLALKAWSFLTAILIVLWWSLGVLVIRKRARSSSDGRPPPKLRSSSSLKQWISLIRPNLRALIWYAPLRSWVIYLVLFGSCLPFVLGGIGTYLPAQWNLWPSLVGGLASLFPGPAVAVLLLGLMIGPLTVLTTIADGLYFRFHIGGLELGLKRPPVLIAISILVFGLIPFWFTLHTVRLLTTSDFSPGRRAGLPKIIEAMPAECPGMKTRPVIVALSGGAMRAAVWGARVIAQIEEEAGPDGPELQAISSVSGGSLAAGAVLPVLRGYSDAHHSVACAEPRGSGRAVRLGLGALAPPGPFSADSLGPLLSGWLVGDLPRTLFAPFARLLRSFSDERPNGGDRAEALERSFESMWRKSASAAGAPTLDSSFLKLFYDDPATMKWHEGMPIWISNGADVRTGNRYMTSPIAPRTEGKLDWPFSAASDLLGVVRADLRISTAVNNSARFPFLEPFGEVLPVDHWREAITDGQVGELIDGGYFENLGLQTALELAQWIENNDPSHSIKPIIVVVTSDGDPDVKAQDIVRCGNPAPVEPTRPSGSGSFVVEAQVLAPLLGLVNVRGGHSAVLLQEAVQKFCPRDDDPEQRFFHFYLPGVDGRQVSLNWVLSDATVAAIWGQIDDDRVGNRSEKEALKKELQTPSPLQTPSSPW